ncbi:response regulator transcription factor [Umezawaea sp. Da 62-37]|uniref:response regulator transcription factor n=1 Tax=Umezawaea sp. Da 62-37 TaxID=3075927 RepID=UPI0028F6C82C|nr:response regulator transcription factor [Umezawaea sp. Da 62-37]WNV82930.1 response regulator transcription factor [Umezawaea sp. Da 62-37]
MTPLKVLLVDDHVLMRAGLSALLEGESALQVVGEAGDGPTALRLCAELRPDVVLMDLRLKDEMDGVATMEAMLEAMPGVSVVILTSYGTRPDVLRAMAAGARGYVLKAGPPEDLFRAIRTAAGGGIGLAPEAAEFLVSEVAAPRPTLSGREVEVVAHLARGLSNREISRALVLSEATVKTHLVRIYRKLDADNRTTAIVEAARRGLIDL